MRATIKGKHLHLSLTAKELEPLTLILSEFEVDNCNTHAFKPELRLATRLLTAIARAKPMKRRSRVVKVGKTHED